MNGTRAAPDATRFDALVVPEIPAMWRAARAICSSGPDAEDLLQDALLRAYRFLPGFDGAHPRAWLLTIVRNTHRNRSRRRRPGLFPDGDPPDSAASTIPTRSAEDEATTHGFDERVDAALASLSGKHRTVVELVDIAGFTYDEAATLLGVPPGTVMSRLHRARRRIRTQLDHHDDLRGNRS